ncbi:hypothetical protein T492DRAFT_876240 [Pavlovales sp. CCMP2436]|nr:hypothetical protein T492DRAFT_876240 [Pavlovales sp. CCMP2436]
MRSFRPPSVSAIAECGSVAGWAAGPTEGAAGPTEGSAVVSPGSLDCLVCTWAAAKADKCAAAIVRSIDVLDSTQLALNMGTAVASFTIALVVDNLGTVMALMGALYWLDGRLYAHLTP